MKSEKHAIDQKAIEVYILAFIGLVVLFKIVANLFPVATGAANELNSSGFPLASLFTAHGAIWYVVAAAIFFLIYKTISSKK
jgi:hypothetical protein